MDLFNYKHIKMFMSIHGPSPLKDNEVRGFLRLGTDFDQNYYEIELPLKVTPGNTRAADEVWPEQNQIDLDLDQLYALKIQRDKAGFSLSVPYPLGGALDVGDGKHFCACDGAPRSQSIENDHDRRAQPKKQWKNL